MLSKKLMPSALCAMLALAPSCKKKDEPKAPAPRPSASLATPTVVQPVPGQPATPAWPGYTPAELNQLALRHNVPLFWRADTNKNGRPDPDEIATLLFYPTREPWVVNGQFTSAFHAAVESLAGAKAAVTGTPSEIERKPWCAAISTRAPRPLSTMTFAASRLMRRPLSVGCSKRPRRSRRSMAS